MNTFTKLSSLLFGFIAIPMLLMAQSASHGVYKPIPKEVLPIVKHTKVLSLDEIATTDFNGNYSGQRFQYTENKKAILRTYRYVMNIVQKGTTVSGTTTITSDNGDFAVIKLRGMVMDDKLYFEEYERRNLKPGRDATPERDSRLRKSDSRDGSNDINLMAGINSKLRRDLYDFV